MATTPDGDPIQLIAGQFLEFEEDAINYTDLPEEVLKNLPEGSTITESLGSPLIEFEEDAINLTGIPDDQFSPIEDQGDLDCHSALSAANGITGSPTGPSPAKSV